MRVAVFDTHHFDRVALEDANSGDLGTHELIFIETRLTELTVGLAQGCQALCCFANDQLNRATLSAIHGFGVRLVALRTAGFNQIDLPFAKKLGLTVVRVPKYSPYSVAEYAVGLMLTLNRKIHKAHNRVHDLNFSLDGLVGFDLHGKTVGTIGTGKIGKVFSQIMRGFGCEVLAYDIQPDHTWAQEQKVQYVDKTELIKKSDVISLHSPLTPASHHILDKGAFASMKKNVLIINTGRGGLIDTPALLEALKDHAIGGACLDVYEEEAGIFFSDLSDSGINDDVLARLTTFPNVLITSHQAFLTQEALKNICETTILSLTHFEKGLPLGSVQI